jgi:hypothetical protein
VQCILFSFLYNCVRSVVRMMFVWLPGSHTRALEALSVEWVAHVTVKMPRLERSRGEQSGGKYSVRPHYFCQT